ncbi:XK-related protein 5a isoform X1 [Melanotaenia boesemani]|uniref:XK-related protein 5a isoform X1 n=2 Tax=Melanotaenia boesemani TaxID=1250792 RepID=UPI001C05457F|nr:XK-related protein 5a isoform X1 [Melanotaenia boesemani]
MINAAAGAVARRMPSVARRSSCWIQWCQAALLGVSALVIIAERSALIYCIGFYLWNEETQWAGLTLGLFLPGTAVQLLSVKWYYDDGDDRRCYLSVIHILHLGIFKRLWDCMRCVLHVQGSVAELGVAVMQQADVAALWLLEALVLTLPQSLLQAYVVVSTDVGIMSPVAYCCGLCVLSISWALVLYSRACCLIRPGHLAMPPAALLCQLVWRAGMLGARVTCLMFFARVFNWWVCGVAGFHWLTASFWLVSQQPDICTGPWCWRTFNGILGLVHVFLFLNVKDGPSRFRMASFYAFMLVENATLLLAASDFLSEASWDNMTLPTTVLCSFLLGATSLVLYYRFLHPKSTEISQGTNSHHMGSTCIEQGESSFSLGDKSLPAAIQNHGSFSLSGVAGSLLDHPGNCGGQPNSSCPCYHHHWLLIRLALKTGDLSKINRAYGAGGAAAILDMEEYNQEFKSNEGITITAGGSCEGVSTSESQGKGLAPLSDCKDEFQSVSEPTSTEQPEEEEDDSLEMESPMESPTSDFKRSSPEGKSVFGDSPEPYFCPTESSSTLYFSADPQSPSSASNPRLDRDTGGLEHGVRLNSIPSDPALHRDVRGLMGRVGPRYISTPKLDSGVLDSPSSVLYLTGPRRQLIMSRRDEDDNF